MVQAKLYPVGFFGVHKMKGAFLKLKTYLGLFKVLGNYIEPSWMSPEASESVFDNSDVTQLLSHGCRTVSKHFREKHFSVKSRFLRIWEVFDVETFFIDLRKKWSFRLQTALKNFLEVRCTCSKYLKGPLRSGLSSAPTLVTIRRIETKWCKKNEKGRPEAPFEFHFSTDTVGVYMHV